MKKILISAFCVGYVQTNCYVLNREGSEECIVFDPGDSGKGIYDELQKRGLSAKAIFLTHGHFDHILGVKALREASGARVYAPAAEKRLLSDAQFNESASMGEPTTVNPDTWLVDGESVTEAGITMKVLSTPGHTEGGCCYYIDSEENAGEPGILLSGDTLFCDSVGRTDLPTGNMATLLKSLKEVLFLLPDDTNVLPGHMGTTTIGHEKRYNPFV